MGAWVLAASLRPGLVTLALIALAAFLLAGHALLGLAQGAPPGTAPPQGARLRRRGRWMWLGVGALLYMTVAQVTVGRPPLRTLEPPAPGEGIGHWTLPDGGGVAYRALAPSGAPAGDPVVFLHGGPGVPILPVLGSPGSGPVDFLMDAGYPVYY